MNISIGNDHAGVDYKNAVVKMLQGRGYEVKNYGTDFIIVGRGIYKADEPEQEALRYKNEGWKAYLDSL